MDSDPTMMRTDRELIQLFIDNLQPAFTVETRVNLVRLSFCVDDEEARRICLKYGFDPDKKIHPLI